MLMLPHAAAPLALVGLFFVAPAGAAPPEPDPSAAETADGYRIEVFADGLDYPTSVEPDGAGGLFVALSGVAPGDPSAEPALLHFDADGFRRTVPVDGLRAPVNDLLMRDGALLISHKTKISALEDPLGADPTLRDLVTGLPSLGDHENNQLTVGPDGGLYVGQGTATNSGVVGLDNKKWLKEHPDVHELAPVPLRTRGEVFQTKDPLSEGAADDTARTSAYQPFDVAAPDGATIPGTTKANGTALRFDADGSNPTVYAWGLRNPFGLLWVGDTLYVTENGLDVRGSRPVANDLEDLYVVKKGAFYGWPDFGSGDPVTDPRFKPDGKPQPTFLLADHPPVERPVATYPKHSAITKLDASPGGAFGYQGQLFIAFFGHMTPRTGTPPEEHGGHRVVRFDPATGESTTFFGPKSHHHGGHGESGHGEGGHGQEPGGSAGPRRPMDVRFTADGSAMYVADFGLMPVDKNGPHAKPGTGVIWKITPVDD
ncbi:PQQ-dependent sugar dehydrogenase [Alienimonas sp. DA493]|uniref:PQQ-dependent sugar dehydrogenase n=1 Tax=Alienimonas sp. DA493 TaxID=3373605 RepID=UPI003754E6E4